MGKLDIFGFNLFMLDWLFFLIWGLFGVILLLINLLVGFCNFIFLGWFLLLFIVIFLFFNGLFDIGWNGILFWCFLLF